MTARILTPALSAALRCVFVDPRVGLRFLSWMDAYRDTPALQLTRQAVYVDAEYLENTVPAQLSMLDEQTAAITTGNDEESVECIRPTVCQTLVIADAEKRPIITTSMVGLLVLRSVASVELADVLDFVTRCSDCLLDLGMLVGAVRSGFQPGVYANLREMYEAMMSDHVPRAVKTWHQFFSVPGLTDYLDIEYNARKDVTVSEQIIIALRSLWA